MDGPLQFVASTIIYLTLLFSPGSNGSNPHAAIYNCLGPQTCVACHPQQASDALNSEHLQWRGKWAHVNTYCTSPAPADYACRSCHASTGKVSNLTVNDVDCLICHQDTYRRALGPLSVPVVVTDWQGNQKTYYTPQKNASGEYEMLPRFDLMPAGTTMTGLAQTVHLPTRATCLGCHAKAGGADGAKRGDLSTASINPSRISDVHLSPQGADLLCQDCHHVSHHQIAGKGIDLRISEGGPPPTCTDGCHDAQPHDSSRLNQHTARVACQTCHIPVFGKDVGTELSRDWTQPHWNPAGCNGQGAWVGEEVRATNVIPQYRFWNGQSFVYDLKDPISPDADGVYTLARALGSIQDGKLYPVKVHTSLQPRHNTSGRMVQYDVLWNFMTGKYEEAAQRGVAFMGLSGAYTWVEARAEQLITHGVEPEEYALECAQCHNGGAQMSLPGLGYTLKNSPQVVCTQCHEAENDPLNWQEVHTKHVSEERKDCSWCHTFSRPERGLSPPAD
jgi:hypothetical protein